MEKSESPWQERASKLFCILVAILGAYLLLVASVRLFLPFLLAALLAAVIRPGALFLEKKLKIPSRIGAIVLLLLLLFLLALVLFFACNSLIEEAERLVAALNDNTDKIGKALGDAQNFLTGITSHLPILSRLRTEDSLLSFWQKLDAKVAELVSDALSQISARIPDLIGKLARGIPSALFFVLTFLIAAFYLCSDGARVTDAILGALPKGIRDRIPDGRRRLWQMTLRYFRAYCLLFALTFIELFLGFSILRLPYTFLPALIIAFVDFLPVLGVGTVLIPWGIFELLRGNIALGTGLLILYGVMLLLRQLEEPRIIGNSLGLHPLLTLVAVYIGLRVGGIVGMLIAPALALLVKSWFVRRQEG